MLQLLPKSHPRPFPESSLFIIRLFALTSQTPVETDGKVTNPYMLNPLLIPSFHIIVRFPPSAYNQPTTSIYIPKITMSVERMAVRFGNMQNVVEFGDWSVQSGRGGVVAGYVAAESVMISTGENAVRGRWNVSKEIVVNNTE